MGGFQLSSSSDGSGSGSGEGGGSSSTTADGGLQARLSASQEASMRQLKEERDAACAQVENLEATVKELVAAMDDATKAKGKFRFGLSVAAVCDGGRLIPWAHDRLAHKWVL